MTEKTTTTMIFRIDPDLKRAFDQMAVDMDLTSSQMLRHMVRNAVGQHAKDRAQKDLPLSRGRK